MCAPRRLVLLLWVVVGVLGGVSACRKVVVRNEPVVVTVGGSPNAQPLLQALEQGPLARELPYLNLHVDLLNGEDGLARLRDGRADLALIAGEPPEGMWSAPVAIDGVVFVVQRGCGVDGMSSVQLRDLFAGIVWRWEDVGGASGAVVQVVSREEGAGTRALIETRLLGEYALTSTALVLLGDEAVLEYVASHPNAVGYLPLSGVDERVNVLAVDGVRPTKEAVAEGQYPFALPLYWVALQEPRGELRRLVDLSLSPVGQEAIAAYYVPVRR